MPDIVLGIGIKWPVGADVLVAGPDSNQPVNVCIMLSVTKEIQSR